MATENKDQSVLNHIDRLVKEEEQLYGQSELSDEDRERLAGLKVELDQCWDLLRQRRALQQGCRPGARMHTPMLRIPSSKQVIPPRTPTAMLLP